MTRKVYSESLNGDKNFPREILMDTTTNYNNLPTVIETATLAPAASSSTEMQFPYVQPRDEKLIEATLEALETGELTPLIKEELRCTIQSRRLKAGKGELKVAFDPKPSQPLTTEEHERIERRREQNRQAAQRFRRKQKDVGTQLVRRTQKIEADNIRLAGEIKKLRMEKEDLRRRLEAHLSVCSRIRMET